MKPQFSDFDRRSFKPCTVEDIDIFERLIKHKLPNSYKEFLMTINGGWVDPPYFSKPLDPEDVREIQYFFGLDVHERIDYSLPDKSTRYCDNLVYEWDRLQGNCGMPEFMLRIAHTNVPNDVLLSLGKDDYGYIYYGHTELGTVTDYNERRAKRTSNTQELHKLGFRLIAHDFDDLLNSAVEMTDEEFLES